MERGLLSRPELASSYDDVVWMYLFQDFSHSEEDRRAERIAIRFGISSWPQHLLIDPADLAVIGDTGRELESFRTAVADRQVGTKALPSQADLRAFDTLAARVLSEEGTELAELHLRHDDRVVRFRAVEKLARDKPEVLVDAAGELLSVPHDQLRYVVCQVLAEHGDTRHARALDALLRDPGPSSRNPNVVRCRAAAALATCGDGDSLEALAPFAGSGNPFNSLTGLSLEAVVDIAARKPAAKARAREVLVLSFPSLEAATAPDADARLMAATLRLAERVHGLLIRLTGQERPFPEAYDGASREALMASWR